MQSFLPKDQNDPSVKTTAERLGKEYNVSLKTIKRDAEFAGGLVKIDPELRKNILEGKTKIDKATIQKLSKSQIETPIKSIQELHKIANKFDSGNVITKEMSLSARVRELIKNANDNDLSITIKGSFLIKNGLESVWRELRGISDETAIMNFLRIQFRFASPILGIIERL